VSQHYERHAEQVTNAFLDLLEDEVRAGINEDHRKELAMLIEAAISTAVYDQLEHAADDIAALSERLRHYAEHYDKPAD
jgi:hypothetical protein